MPRGILRPVPFHPVGARRFSAEAPRARPPSPIAEEPTALDTTDTLDARLACVNARLIGLKARCERRLVLLLRDSDADAAPRECPGLEELSLEDAGVCGCGRLSASSENT